MSTPPDSRRDFIKKALYVPPAIVSVMVYPAYTKEGSEKPDFGNQGNQGHEGQGNQARGNRGDDGLGG